MTPELNYVALYQCDRRNTICFYLERCGKKEKKKNSELCVFLESQVTRCLMMMIFIDVVRVAMWLYFHESDKN